MQEEVENRTVTLVISAVKLTGRELKAALVKYLASRKEQKQGKAEVKPHGKQTVKQLVGQSRCMCTCGKCYLRSVRNLRHQCSADWFTD